MTRGRRSSSPKVLALGAVAVLLATAAGWALDGRTPSALVIAAVAFGGAGVVAWLTVTRPVAAFGVLFLLSSVSRVTLDLSVGTMRIEQPAIAVALLVLALTGGFAGLRSVPRLVVSAAVGFGVYLGVLALSSALVAPEPATSLRLVAWQAISLAGALAAFLLLRAGSAGAVKWLAFGGAWTAVLGIGLATLFLVAGPDVNAGIQSPYDELPKVHALSWEANLYASFLVGTLPFALEMARGRFRSLGLGFAALVLVGIPLGITRGAYLGLAAGLAVYVGIVLVRQRTVRWLVPAAMVGAVALVIGLAGSTVLLPNTRERAIAAAGPTAVVSPSPTSSSVAPSTAGPAFSPSPTASSVAPSTAGPTAVVSPSTAPTAVATALPSLAAYPDTLEFRLKRVPIALADIEASPIIGLGAESFGQRHRDTSQAGAPDHIAILAVAALYESGVVGTVGLGIGFLLILTGLWRVSADPRRTGAAAAFAGSIVGLLIAFQATNALHFGSNWLIVGAAAALITAADERTATSHGGRPTSDRD